MLVKGGTVNVLPAPRLRSLLTNAVKFGALTVLFGPKSILQPFANCVRFVRSSLVPSLNTKRVRPVTCLRLDKRMLPPFATDKASQ